MRAMPHSLQSDISKSTSAGTSRALYALTSPTVVAVGIFIVAQLLICNLSVNIADEGFFLYSAKQIASGLLPYRDFYMQVTPGNYYVLAAVFNMFGTYVIASRLLYILYGAFVLLVLAKTFPLSRRWLYFYLAVVILLQLGPSGFFSYNTAYGIAIFSFSVFLQGVKRNSTKFIFAAGVVTGIAYLFKQNVGAVTALSLYFVLLITPLVKRPKQLAAYTLGFTIPLTIMVVYFWLNNALGPLFYWTVIYAGLFKGANYAFVLHRLMLIPVILLGSWLYARLRMKRRVKTYTVLLIALVIVTYFVSYPTRMSRLIDYVVDPAFYVQSIIYGTSGVILARYIANKHKTEQDISLLLYSTFLLALFVMKTSQGYDRGVLATASPFLIPMAIIFLKSRIVKAVAVVTITLLTFPFFYNPFSPSASYVGNYPLESITEYSSLRPATLLKFNPTENRELVDVVHYIDRNTKPGEKIICFPYCPMMYILSDRPGATYYGIFGLTNDQNGIINQLKAEPPNVAVVIKQGDFILTPTLHIPSVVRIDSYIRHNYRSVRETKNFTIYSRAPTGR